jgi:hypothetical protein
VKPVRCDEAHNLLLDLLYGLLDTDEQAALNDHLSGCAGCQAALVRARAQQELLAVAAKFECAGVSFQAPEAPAAPAAATDPSVPTQVPRPRRTAAVLRMPKAPRPARPWRRWAVAAGILLAFGGTGLYGADRYAQEVAAAQRQVDATARDVAAARSQVDELQRRRSAVLTQRDRDLADLDAADRERIRLSVDGPFEGGQGPVYAIVTRSFDGKPAPANLSVRLDNAATDEESEKAVGPLLKNRHSEGNLLVPAPDTVTGSGGSRATLVVEASRDGAPLARETFPARPEYLTLLTVDRPTYRPGHDTVHFRVLILDRFTLRPAAEDFRLTFKITAPPSSGFPNGSVFTILAGDNGLRRAEAGKADDLLLGPDGRPVRGIGAGDWPLAFDSPEGDYLLTVTEEDGRFPTQSRVFRVRHPSSERLLKELDSDGPTRLYRPGDEVAVVGRASFGSKPVAHRSVGVTLWADGLRHDLSGAVGGQALATTDANGVIRFRFRLPTNLRRGDVSLSLEFNDGYGAERIERTVPVDVGRRELHFTPEGGVLVAGKPNRVYIESRTHLGHPAGLRGRLLEDGRQLTDVSTLVEAVGLGVVEFTPRQGARYEIETQPPQGAPQRFALPEVRDGVLGLRVDGAVAAAGTPLHVKLPTASDRPLVLGLTCRGRLLDAVVLPPGRTEATLHPPADLGGVCQVTLFEEVRIIGAVPGGLGLALGAPAAASLERHGLRPVAQRLVYRRPAGRVDVTLQAESTAAAEPGRRTKLHVQTADETGRPVPALLLLAVTEAALADGDPSVFPLLTTLPRPEDVALFDLLPPAEVPDAILDALFGAAGPRQGEPVRQPSDGDERVLAALTSALDRTHQRQEKAAAIRAAADAELAELLRSQNAVHDQAAAGETGDYRAAVAVLARWDRLSERLRGAIRWTLFGLLALTLLLVAVQRRRVPGLAWGVAAGAAAVVLLCLARLPWGATSPSGLAEVQVAGLTSSAEPTLPPLDKFVVANRERQAPDEADDVRKEGKGGEGKENQQQGQRAEKRTSEPSREAKKDIEAPRSQEIVRLVPDPTRFDHQEDRDARFDRSNTRGRSLREKETLTQQPTDGADALARGQTYQLEQSSNGNRSFAPTNLPPTAPSGSGDKAGAMQENWHMRKRAEGIFIENERKEAEAKQKSGDSNAKPEKEKGGQGALTSSTMPVRPFANTTTRGPGAYSFYESPEVTLYWDPVLVMPANGKADVSFDFGAARPAYRVTVYAHTLNGRLGANVGVVLPQQPQPNAGPTTRPAGAR